MNEDANDIIKNQNNTKTQDDKFSEPDGIHPVVAARLEKEKVDLVLMDVKMPIMNNKESRHQKLLSSS